MEHITRFVIAGLCMGAIDIFWLGWVAKKLYFAEMKDILRPKFQAVPAVLFYLIYVFGIVFFAVNPALDGGSWQQAALRGAAFGFVAYATYDLTALAVLKGFSKKIVIIDMVWGTFLTAVVATITYIVAG